MAEKKRFWTKPIIAAVMAALLFESAALPAFGREMPAEAEGAAAAEAISTESVPATVPDYWDAVDTLAIPVETPEITSTTYCYEESMAKAVYALPDASYWMQYHSNEVYKLLTADERKLWSRLEAACIAVMCDSSSRIYNIHVETDDLHLDHLTGLQLNYMFKLSHPQFFIISNSCSYGAGFVFLYPEFYNGADRAAAVEEFRTVVDGWVEQASVAELPEEREHIAHDLICTNCVYDYDALDSKVMYDDTTTRINWDQGAYSLIHDGTTVCAGYAATAGLLLTRLGIESLNVASLGHAWNVIQLHHHWFVLDVTWDDGSFGEWCYADYNVAGQDENGNCIGGHDLETNDFSDWRSLAPDMKGYSNCYPDYDAYSGSHENPYFSVDGYRYFVANGCTDYGPYLAEVVDSPAGLDLADAPATVTYLTKTYQVSYTPDPDQLVKNFVARLYRIFLDRTASADEISGWSQQLLNGTKTAGEVAGGFIFSPEFQNRNLCNEHYLEYLYRGLFDRPADADGFNGWISLIDEGYSRERVAHGFLTSPEFQNLCSSFGVYCGNGLMTVPVYGTIQKAHCTIDGCSNEAPVVILVRGLYNTVFGRIPAQEEVDFWVELMAQHRKDVTARVMVNSFLNGEEYANLNRSNGDYVKDLYRAIFNREADADGYSYWVEKLESGEYSREKVLNGFTGSQEFLDQCNHSGIEVGPEL